MACATTRRYDEAHHGVPITALLTTALPTTALLITALLTTALLITAERDGYIGYAGK